MASGEVGRSFSNKDRFLACTANGKRNKKAKGDKTPRVAQNRCVKHATEGSLGGKIVLPNFISKGVISLYLSVGQLV